MIDYQSIRAAYIAAGQPDVGIVRHDEWWDSSILHLSDLGSCPRQVALRVGGYPEKIVSEDAKNNKRVMFWLAYELHYLTYSAMRWAGLLYDYELKVEAPTGWSGRLDMLHVDKPGSEKLVLYDEKTSHPNQMKYSKSLPKKKDMLQIISYYLYPPVTPIDEVRIEYADRGGQNTPQVKVIVPSEWLTKEVASAMVELEEALVNTPEPLSREFVIADNEKSVYLRRDWRCKYCPYYEHELGLCAPEEGEVKVASCDADGHWRLTKTGFLYRDAILNWGGVHLES
jgi:hypothetical protein